MYRIDWSEHSPDIDMKAHHRTCADACPECGRFEISTGGADAKILHRSACPLSASQAVKRISS